MQSGTAICLFHFYCITKFKMTKNNFYSSIIICSITSFTTVKISMIIFSKIFVWFTTSFDVVRRLAFIPSDYFIAPPLNSFHSLTSLFPRSISSSILHSFAFPTVSISSPLQVNVFHSSHSSHMAISHCLSLLLLLSSFIFYFFWWVSMSQTHILIHFLSSFRIYYIFFSF